LHNLWVSTDRPFGAGRRQLEAAQGAKAPGTLREKLYGQGRARLGADHPAVRFRNIADLPGS